MSAPRLGGSERRPRRIHCSWALRQSHESKPAVLRARLLERRGGARGDEPQVLRDGGALLTAAGRRLLLLRLLLEVRSAAPRGDGVLLGGRPGHARHGGRRGRRGGRERRRGHAGGAGDRLDPGEVAGAGGGRRRRRPRLLQPLRLVRGRVPRLLGGHEHRGVLPRRHRLNLSDEAREGIPPPQSFLFCSETKRPC